MASSKNGVLQQDVPDGSDGEPEAARQQRPSAGQQQTAAVSATGSDPGLNPAPPDVVRKPVCRTPLPPKRIVGASPLLAIADTHSCSRCPKNMVQAHQPRHVRTHLALELKQFGAFMCKNCGRRKPSKDRLENYHQKTKKCDKLEIVKENNSGSEYVIMWMQCFPGERINDDCGSNDDDDETDPKNNVRMKIQSTTDEHNSISGDTRPEAVFENTLPIGRHLGPENTAHHNGKPVQNGETNGSKTNGESKHLKSNGETKHIKENEENTHFATNSLTTDGTTPKTVTDIKPSNVSIVVRPIPVKSSQSEDKSLSSSAPVEAFERAKLDTPEKPRQVTKIDAASATDIPYRYASELPIIYNVTNGQSDDSSSRPKSLILADVNNRRSGGLNGRRGPDISKPETTYQVGSNGLLYCSKATNCNYYSGPEEQNVREIDVSEETMDAILMGTHEHQPDLASTSNGTVQSKSTQKRLKNAGKTERVMKLIRRVNAGTIVGAPRRRKPKTEQHDDATSELMATKGRRRYGLSDSSSSKEAAAIGGAQTAAPAQRKDRVKRGVPTAFADRRVTSAAAATSRRHEDSDEESENTTNFVYKDQIDSKLTADQEFILEVVKNGGSDLLMNDVYNAFLKSSAGIIASEDKNVTETSSNCVSKETLLSVIECVIQKLDDAKFLKRLAKIKENLAAEKQVKVRNSTTLAVVLRECTRSDEWHLGPILKPFKRDFDQRRMRTESE